MSTVSKDELKPTDQEGEISRKSTNKKWYIIGGVSIAAVILLIIIIAVAAGGEDEVETGGEPILGDLDIEDREGFLVDNETGDDEDFTPAPVMQIANVETLVDLESTKNLSDEDTLSDYIKNGITLTIGQTTYIKVEENPTTGF